MHTPDQHRWTISCIDDVADHRSGNAAVLTEAWTAALAAGWDALVAAELRTLAVRIDGELEALYSPGRDHTGKLNLTEIARDFGLMLEDVRTAAPAEQLLRRLVLRSEHRDEFGRHRVDLAVPPASSQITRSNSGSPCCCARETTSIDW